MKPIANMQKRSKESVSLFKSRKVVSSSTRNQMSTLSSIALALQSNNLKNVIDTFSLSSLQSGLSESHLKKWQEDMDKIVIVTEFFHSREKLESVLALCKIGTTFPNFQKTID
jgi:hypothetical protein